MLEMSAILKLKAAQKMLGRHGFVVVLNGSTGYKYLRCRECNGSNNNPKSHELNRSNVQHQSDCELFYAISEPNQ